MDFVVFLGEAEYLCEGEQSGEYGMVGEDNIVEIDFASLIVADEVTVWVVKRVESEAGEVHGYEIKVHAFDAELREWYLFLLKF